MVMPIELFLAFGLVAAVSEQCGEAVDDGEWVCLECSEALDDEAEEEA